MYYLRGHNEKLKMVLLFLEQIPGVRVSSLLKRQTRINNKLLCQRHKNQEPN